MHKTQHSIYYIASLDQILLQFILNNYYELEFGGVGVVIPETT